MSLTNRCSIENVLHLKTKQDLYIFEHFTQVFPEAISFSNNVIKNVCVA